MPAGRELSTGSSALSRYLIARQWSIQSAISIRRIKNENTRSHILIFRNLLIRTVSPICRTHEMKKKSSKILRSTDRVISANAKIGFAYTCFSPASGC